MDINMIVQICTIFGVVVGLLAIAATLRMNAIQQEVANNLRAVEQARTLEENETARTKMLNEFGKPIHEKRLEAYLQIFAFVSGFIKEVHPVNGVRSINRARFEELSKQYFKLDSQWSLLFSENMWQPSAALIVKFREILCDSKQNDPIELPEDIVESLGKVEDGLKYEIGVFAFKNPGTMTFGDFNKIMDEIKKRLTEQ